MTNIQRVGRNNNKKNKIKKTAVIITIQINILSVIITATSSNQDDIPVDRQNDCAIPGRLPIRTGLTGGRRVFMEYDTGGLPKREITIAEALKDQAGYRTGMVGKWHLGINQYNSTDGTHLPVHHGFDFVGTNLPLSNLWECREQAVQEYVRGVPTEEVGPDFRKCYLYFGDQIVQQPIHFDGLTEKMVDEFKGFISSPSSKNCEGGSNHQRKPYFFYFSFPHVHSFQFADQRFLGKSKRGIFGDNLNEMHWAVSEIVRAVEAADERHNEQTLIIFMSDHGPHKELCNYGGSTGGLRGKRNREHEMPAWDAIRRLLISHSPPLVFHLGRDPFELFPLQTAGGSEQVDAVIALAEKWVKAHVRSIVDVPEEMGHFTPKVIPCCTVEACSCNYDYQRLSTGKKSDL